MLCKNISGTTSYCCYALQYCKLNNPLVQLFTSSLYLAGMISSLFAGTLTQKYGRRNMMLAAGYMYLVGIILQVSVCAMSGRYSVHVRVRVPDGAHVTGAANGARCAVAPKLPRLSLLLGLRRLTVCLSCSCATLLRSLTVPFLGCVLLAMLLVSPPMLRCTSQNMLWHEYIRLTVRMMAHTTY